MTTSSIIASHSLQTRLSERDEARLSGKRCFLGNILNNAEFYLHRKKRETHCVTNVIRAVEVLERAILVRVELGVVVCWC